MTDPKPLPCKCGAEKIGISDGSSIHSYKCSACGHRWPRQATIRGIAGLRYKDARADPAPGDDPSLMYPALMNCRDQLTASQAEIVELKAEVERLKGESFAVKGRALRVSSAWADQRNLIARMREALRKNIDENRYETADEMAAADEGDKALAAADELLGREGK